MTEQNDRVGSTSQAEHSHIPDVADWKVIQSGNRVFVESETIAHKMLDYDDAWLEITGNMLVEQKLALAEYVLARLNRPNMTQALEDAFKMGQRVGCSYGVGELDGARKKKYEAMLAKWGCAPSDPPVQTG
jgi:hypothetical protein